MTPPAVLHALRHPAPPPPEAVDPVWLPRVAREAGADHVAFFSLDHLALADEVAPTREALPTTCALVAFVVRTAYAPIGSPLRSVANGELHRVSDHTEAVGAAVVEPLRAKVEPMYVLPGTGASAAEVTFQADDGALDPFQTCFPTRLSPFSNGDT